MANPKSWRRLTPRRASSKDLIKFSASSAEDADSNERVDSPKRYSVDDSMN